MKKYIMLVLALCSCTSTMPPWPEKPECTLVNNTSYVLEVFCGGQQVSAELQPGQVLAVLGDKPPVAVVAKTKRGEPVGSAFHHYWFRGEVWVVNIVTKLNED